MLPHLPRKIKPFLILIPTIIVLFFFVPSAMAIIGFDDVPPGHMFYDEIMWIADKEITSGCSVTPPLYCPDAPVSRGQMAVFMYRLAGNGTYGPIVDADTLHGMQWYDFAPAGLDYVRSMDSMTLGPGENGTLTFTCASGKAAISGGGNFSSLTDTYIIASYPPGDNQWVVKGRNEGSFDVTFWGYGICVDLNPG
jgi:hypothetical protein